MAKIFGLRANVRYTVNNPGMYASRPSPWADTAVPGST